MDVCQGVKLKMRVHDASGAVRHRRYPIPSAVTAIISFSARFCVMNLQDCRGVPDDDTRLYFVLRVRHLNTQALG
eukprot:174442-Amorphochlora_amoeboformis.AAC.1